MRTLLIAAAVGVLLAGCGSSTPPWEGTQLDYAGWSTCQAFAREVSNAGGFELAYVLPTAQRAPIVTAVRAYGADTSNAALKEQAVGFPTAAASPAPLAWRAGINRLVGACADAGYPDLSLKPGG